MNKLRPAIAAPLLVLMIGACVDAYAGEAVLPAHLSAADIGGAVFERDDVVTTTGPDGTPILDVTSLLASDGKFASGMYRAGKSRFEILGHWVV
jgi:hypothetical protein